MRPLSERVECIVERVREREGGAPVDFVSEPFSLPGPKHYIASLASNGTYVFWLFLAGFIRIFLSDN